MGREFPDPDDPPLHSCLNCDDGEGDCAFPWYGTAPGNCATALSFGYVEKDWGIFVPDPEAPGFGTWARCTKCGHGWTDEQIAKALEGE
jgi:hypothetical protein